jgi:hypothetical protein
MERERGLPDDVTLGEDFPFRFILRIFPEKSNR